MNKFNAKRWAKEIYANEGTIIQQMGWRQLEEYVFERCAGLSTYEQDNALAEIQHLIREHAVPWTRREKPWTTQ